MFDSIAGSLFEKFRSENFNQMNPGAAKQISENVEFTDLNEDESQALKNILAKAVQDKDGRWSYDGNIDLSNLRLKTLPVKFKKVGGDFHCYGNQLQTLEGAPEEVGGDFWCHRNGLKDLVGGPKKVEGNFNCAGNQLISLKGAPEEVGGAFDCSKNQLRTLDGAPKKVGREFWCQDNPVHPAELQKTVDRPYLKEPAIVGECAEDQGSTGSVCEGLKDVQARWVDTGKVSEEVFKELEVADTTPTKKYVNWMCRMYVQTPDRKEHIIDVVKLFDQKVRRNIIKGSQSDINQYKDLEAIDAALEEVAGEITKGEQEELVRKDAPVLYEDDDVLVIQPLTHAASCKYGANTKWCVAGRTPEHWNSYFRRGVKLVYFINKKNQKKYAASVDSNGSLAFFDEEDRSIGKPSFLKKMKIG